MKIEKGADMKGLNPDKKELLYINPKPKFPSTKKVDTGYFKRQLRRVRRASKKGL